ncbi:uncharacterized protein TNCV_2111641 [Trichonephila clavipes]|nr:uncharacterized protein TNCV_2111641 [Trichonephila clavipes]
MYMVAQICVRVHLHAGTTCVTNPVRKLHLLKNRLTVQIKFQCMILILKVHRKTLGQLRCSSIFRTTYLPPNALGGDSAALDVGFRRTIMRIYSALPQEWHSSSHKTTLKKSGRSWSLGISSYAMTGQ